MVPREDEQSRSLALQLWGASGGQAYVDGTGQGGDELPELHEEARDVLSGSEAGLTVGGLSAGRRKQSGDNPPTQPPRTDEGCKSPSWGSATNRLCSMRAHRMIILGSRLGESVTRRESFGCVNGVISQAAGHC